MTSWFSQLNPRERLVVILLAILCTFTLLYLLLVEPVQQARLKAIQTLQAEQSLLEYMQKSAKRVLAKRRYSVASSSATPFILVDRARKQLGLPSPDRMTPKGQKAIKFRYRQVSFDRLMQMVQMLEQQGLLLAKIHVKRLEGKTGMVSARIEMEKT